MQLAEYYRIRDGLQVNASPNSAPELAHIANDLREALASSPMLHSVEVDTTEDPDRLVIAMCGFAPGFSPTEVAEELERLWVGDVGHDYWAVATSSTRRAHAELQGATLTGAKGRYATVHLIAQEAEVPAQPEVVPAGPVIVPQVRRSRGRLFRRDAVTRR